MTHLSFLFRSQPAMCLVPHDAMHSYSLMAPVSWHRQRKVGWPEGHCLFLHHCHLLLVLQPARGVGHELCICQGRPGFKPVLDGCLQQGAHFELDTLIVAYDRYRGSDLIIIKVSDTLIAVDNRQRRLDLVQMEACVASMHHGSQAKCMQSLCACECLS